MASRRFILLLALISLLLLSGCAREPTRSRTTETKSTIAENRLEQTKRPLAPGQRQQLLAVVRRLLEAIDRHDGARFCATLDRGSQRQLLNLVLGQAASRPTLADCPAAGDLFLAQAVSKRPDLDRKVREQLGRLAQARVSVIDREAARVLLPSDSEPLHLRQTEAGWRVHFFLIGHNRLSV